MKQVFVVVIIHQKYGNYQFLKICGDIKGIVFLPKFESRNHLLKSFSQSSLEMIIVLIMGVLLID